MMRLDHRLETDSTFIMDLMLSQVRLHHNAAFPWIILIPQKHEVIEIIDLNANDQLLLMQEISLASRVMHHLYQPTKLNIANLGNIISQLHIHIVVRFKDDKAWPGPIWNSGVNEFYTSALKEEKIVQIKAAFLKLS